MDEVIKLTNSQELRIAVEAIQDPSLKTIETINLLGKVALITAAAALTAGAAGAAIGRALEAGGVTGLAYESGVLVAESLAFTITTSQIGQTIAFGKPSQGFFTELGWNLLMLGVAKSAAAGYARVFELSRRPQGVPDHL